MLLHYIHGPARERGRSHAVSVATSTECPVAGGGRRGGRAAE